MGNTICIFYCCVIIPLLFAIWYAEKNTKKYIVYMAIGLTSCLVASLVNGFIQQASYDSYLVITTTYTPITEEILKAIPVLYYGIFFSDKQEELIGVGFMTGIGFAILENGVTLLLKSGSASLVWALLRGFSTSLMHGMTTALVGFGIALIRKRKKLFIMGTFTFLTLAIIYHATFNVFIQSDLQVIAIVFPFVSYMLLFYISDERMLEKARARSAAKKAKKAAESVKQDNSPAS